MRPRPELYYSDIVKAMRVICNWVIGGIGHLTVTDDGGNQVQRVPVGKISLDLISYDRMYQSIGKYKRLHIITLKVKVPN